MLNEIVRMYVGSILYGTHTDKSDIDIKGIFISDIEEVILGKAPKHIRYSTNKSNTKNTEKDMDVEMFSSQTLIK